jgi:glycerol-3-phosphate dehydrogenase
MVVYAVRHEFARTLEDVLSRRTRSLLLDARAALRAAPGVAALMASELERDPTWQQRQLAAFDALVRAHYLP